MSTVQCPDPVSPPCSPNYSWLIRGGVGLLLARLQWSPGQGQHQVPLLRLVTDLLNI